MVHNYQYLKGLPNPTSPPPNETNNHFIILIKATRRVPGHGLRGAVQEIKIPNKEFIDSCGNTEYFCKVFNKNDSKL